MNHYEQSTQEVRDAFNALCKGRVEAAVKAEREACAEFLESTNLGGLPEVTALQYARLIKGFAKGIRARNET